MSAQGPIELRFAELRRAGRSGLVTFLTAGDPDFETSLAILEGLPAAGADLIELGMPFTDPVADGPTIQAASLRALAAGASMRTTLELVRRFRATEVATPMVLMGYFNPIHAYGPARFAEDAGAAGVDGLIIVDLPPEEDREFGALVRAQGIHIVRLATPTTDEARLARVLDGAGGFLYYVSITGITGAAAPDLAAVEAAAGRIRKHTELPLAVGFGIRSPEQARAIAGIADAAVIGTSLVGRLAEHLDAEDCPDAGAVAGVLDLVASLAAGVRAA